jgi:hypothetical protein
MKIKSFIIISLLVFNSGLLFSQKKEIDTSVFGKWPSLAEPKITNDGKYCLYTIYNVPLYSSSCIIQKIDGSWKKELKGIATATFSEDSRKAIFNRGNDTVALLTLENGMEQYIQPANSFQLFMQAKIQWIACQLNNPKKELLIKCLSTNQEVRIKGVETYLLNKTGNSIVYVTADTGNARTHMIHWGNLSNGDYYEQPIVWQGSGESNFTLDDEGTQLAFVVSGSTPFSQSVWHYRRTDSKARQIADSSTVSIPSGTYIESVANFSLDGKRLFFYLKENPYVKPDADAVMVDVWSYHDKKIQSHQYKEDLDLTAGYYYKGPRRFLSTLDINSLEINRLQFKDEEIKLLKNDVSDEWARVIYRQADESEQSWNALAQPTCYLVSTLSGARKILPLKFDHISSTGRYLLAEVEDSSIYTYEIGSEEVTNITKNLPIESSSSTDYTFSQRFGKNISYTATWLKYDDRVIVKDGYDLWALDPRGEQPAVNLTNGYGARNKIKFSIIGYNRFLQNGNPLILDAFNDDNQNNGFFKISVGSNKDPEKLTSGPYIYAAVPYAMHLDGSIPVKARDADVYLVSRTGPNLPKNYFWTRDFKTFVQLTDLHPEKEYKWYTSELISYQSSDNRKKLGILYKPDNFDPNRKYPLIVNIYEKKTERLNSYITPGFSDGDINIPYFVNRGYLVFTPDIDYKIGYAGESALQSIIGGVTYLSKMPFINSKKIGICGHSFGGFETLYAITHSDLFTAAFADAGSSNFISQYGSVLLSDGRSIQPFVEKGQIRMGCSLWEKAEVYINNSPIFAADRVNTPLLIVNNKMDALVHFEQGLQMFLALRRLGKKAWLLQYDDEMHSVGSLKNKKDLTVRLSQFFDYYLKDSPCPIWMLDGIPAKMKGIENGYKLDSTGRTPGPGLLTEEEQHKVDSLNHSNK